MLGVNTLIVPLVGKKVFVVDPAACSLSKDENLVTDYLVSHKLDCVGVVLTHSHFDHIMGIYPIKNVFPKCSIAIHKNEYEELISPPGRMNKIVISFFGMPDDILSEIAKQPDANVSLSDGDSLEKLVIDSNSPLKNDSELRESLLQWAVIHTPGHTTGSICLYNKEKKILLSGDTIFDYGGYGRTDLYGGNESKILKSIQHIKSIIEDGTIVYPGHDSIFTYERGV